MPLQPFCGCQSLQYVFPRFSIINGLRTDALKTLLKPLLFGQISDVHQLNTNVATVSLLQSRDNLLQRGFLLTDEQRATLKGRIKIGFRQTMVRKLQIWNRLPLHYAQRIKACLLMTAVAVGTNEMEYFNLLPLMFYIDATGTRCGNRPCPATTEQLKVLLNSRMGYIKPIMSVNTGK